FKPIPSMSGSCGPTLEKSLASRFFRVSQLQAIYALLSRSILFICYLRSLLEPAQRITNSPYWPADYSCQLRNGNSGHELPSVKSMLHSFLKGCLPREAEQDGRLSIRHCLCQRDKKISLDHGKALSTGVVAVVVQTTG